ncbi:MAG: universal stress protein [Pseudomonadota bacterium]
MSNQILTCIDGSIYSASVADHAAWAAGRLKASVQLLQVLGRREASSADRSGRMVAGARRQLLEQLADLDAERAKLLRSQARLDLEEAEARLRDAGVEDVTPVLRNGDLLETLLALEETAAMTVVGKRGEAADFAQLHLGSNLERILRTAQKPVLVASRAFQPITACLVAFDGQQTAIRAVEAMACSPLFQGLETTLVLAGDATDAARRSLDAAEKTLTDAGFAAKSVVRPGSPITVIPAELQETAAGILVMGAYSHSRLRTLVIGSTTSEMIRACRVPIMVYR